MKGCITCINWENKRVNQHKYTVLYVTCDYGRPCRVVVVVVFSHSAHWLRQIERVMFLVWC